MSDSAALQILQTTFGYPSFRSQQQAIIDHVVGGGDAFVLMPTGGGKSLCYQIPAMLRDGVGVVISPLIALMHDQVQALCHNGVRAAELNSSLSLADQEAIAMQLRDGALDLLYVSPERLLNDGALQSTLTEANVALIAVDEAHCVSQWGHDFRPEYLEIGRFVREFSTAPVMALTATADTPTQKEILEKLGLESAEVFVESFDRPNIQYQIHYKENPTKQIQQFVSTHFSDEAGIVYCLSRAKTESLADSLQSAGIRALPYHAGLAPDLRKKHQEIFLQEEAVVMVATIAFGMGIDKPNVRFVIHADLPKSMEAYYQETGRAGRDGLPATAMLLYGVADLVQLGRMISQSDAPDERKRVERMKLSSLVGLCETTRCRRQVLLEYFGENVLEPCGNCDTCLFPVDSFDGTVAAQKALSVVYRSGQRFGQKHLIDILCGHETEKVLQFRHEQLPTFGVGTEFTAREWQSIFRQLVAAGHLAVDFEGYGALTLTARSKSLLNRDERVELRKDYRPEKKRRSKERTKATTRSLDEQSEALFQRLRQARLELARESNVPPYVIFHDKTLVEIAERRPKSLAELRGVGGVGETKLERYGERILAEILEE